MPAPTETADPIEDIRAALAEAERQRLTPFGAESHRWRLHRPCPPAALAQFEAEHGVRLPPAYRRFLAELADGGAGPYYGVPPLEDAAEICPFERLAEPCPLGPGDAIPAAPDGIDPDDYDAIEEACRGTLTVAIQGCTYYTQLVVSGPHAGRLFNVDVGGDAGDVPVWVDAPDFLAWYARWLARLLCGGDVGWWGYGCTEGEAELVRGLAGGTVEERVFRLAAVPQLGEVGPALRVAVRRLCGEADPAVRGAAFAALVGCAEAEDAPRLDEALADAAPAVRAGALRGLRRVAPEVARVRVAGAAVDGDAMVRRAALDVAVALGAGVEVARSLLADADEDVLRAALAVLADAGALRVDDVRPLIADPRPAVVRNALWRLQSAPDAPLPPELVACLDDPRAELRAAALQALRTPWAAALIDRLADALTGEDDPVVRKQLLQALARSDDDRALFPLIAALRADDGMDRYDAITAVQRFGRRTALPALRAMVSDRTMPRRADDSGGTVSTAWSVGQYAARVIAELEGRRRRR